MSRKILNVFVSTVALMGLSACGGGSNSASPPVVTTANTPPTAVAASPIGNITEGGSFTLNSTGSSDADGDNLSVSWRQTAGPDILSETVTNQPSLTLLAPSVDEETVLTFELTVSDGASTATDNFSVTVESLETAQQALVTEQFDDLESVASSSAGGYTLFWQSSDDNNLYSTQNFTAEGQLIGEELIAEITFTDPIFDLGDADPNRSIIFSNIEAVYGGDILYYPITSLKSVENIVYFFDGTFRGPLSGIVEAPGDRIFEDEDVFLSECEHSVFQNQLFCIAATNDSFFDIESGRDIIDISIFGGIVQPNGTMLAPFDLILNHTDPLREVTVTQDDTIFLLTHDFPPIETISLFQFDTNGVQLGSEISVDLIEDGSEEDIEFPLSIDALTNDQAIIVWEQCQTQGLAEDCLIMGRVINPNNGETSETFRINNFSTGMHIDPVVKRLPNNQAIVTWVDENEGLKARVIDSTGNGVTDEFLLIEDDDLDSTPIYVEVLSDQQVVIGVDDLIFRFSPIGR